MFFSDIVGILQEIIAIPMVAAGQLVFFRKQQLERWPTGAISFVNFQRRPKPTIARVRQPAPAPWIPAMIFAWGQWAVDGSSSPKARLDVDDLGRYIYP